MKTRLITAGVTAALVGALAGTGSAATPTSVTTLNASASSSSIAVSGTAALGGQDPVIVGEDGVGDAVGSPAATTLGLDMDKLLISQPSASTSSLLFTIELGGLQGGGIPETILYNWDVSVDGGAAAGGRNLSIKTMRSRASVTTNTNPYAGVFTCVPATGGFTCTEQTRLTNVVYDEAAAEIRMTIPMSALGAQAGSLIEAWARSTNAFWIGPSASGATTLSNVFDTGTHDGFTVPTPSVRMGIAPTGSPVSYSTTGTITPTGAFSGSLAKPETAGSYDVAAEACFGENCGTRTTTITI